MYIGLDVGGTHTDAVLLGKENVEAAYKAVTNHANLAESVGTALREITKNIDPKSITSVNLSTTLSTNAIVEGKIEKVGVIVSSGPGIDPANFRMGKHYFTIQGSIDHRGSVVSELDGNELGATVESCDKNGIRTYAAITKFSTRNPSQEEQMAEACRPSADFITMGHRLSGQLSFPRRVATAYYNSAVWRLFGEFSAAVRKSLAGTGIEAPINILKADGGTMPLVRADAFPVETILSGPASSIMGIISLCHITDDCIILDIGGTTTDIAIFASGAPLIERDGISFDENPTLVRSLKTKSIGIGGDSFINVSKKGMAVGPERKGPSMADGGKHPSLIDALNVKGIISYNDRDRSMQGIRDLAKKAGTTPEDLSTRVIDIALDTIKTAVDRMLYEINEKPVYTIHELLEGKKIVPEKLYVMGGPARAFMEILSGRLNIDVTVPKNFDVANAIGAALAKNTFEAELFADTSRGVLTVPNLMIKESVDGHYSLDRAEADAKRHLASYLSGMGVTVAESEIDIMESTSFKMVEGFYSVGRDIRVKCQMRPGVIMDLY